MAEYLQKMNEYVDDVKAPPTTTVSSCSQLDPSTVGEHIGGMRMVYQISDSPYDGVRNSESQHVLPGTISGYIRNLAGGNLCLPRMRRATRRNSRDGLISSVSHDY